MEWPWEMVERDHVIQDPTSPEKVRLLGEYVRLTADCQVLDMGCGKAGPAVVLAEPSAAGSSGSNCVRALPPRRGRAWRSAAWRR
jgi:cyclopropane fatty-acyl-phospholipid synthase-like methyltransferase